jgi:protein gp37
MIKECSDLRFLFLTKRIERFMECIPADWGEGYDNVTVGCTVENQKTVDRRLPIFSALPIKHKAVICQPLIERVNLGHVSK